MVAHRTKSTLVGAFRRLEQIRKDRNRRIAVVITTEADGSWLVKIFDGTDPWCDKVHTGKNLDLKLAVQEACYCLESGE